MPTTRPRHAHFSRALHRSTDESEALSLASDDVETTIDGSPMIRGGDHAGLEDEGPDGDEEIEEEDVNEDAVPSSPGRGPLPPSGLKEISSLASWTVSTNKPGCGVTALRSPDTNLFWQSDGPQPHLLSIHFFKLVSIIHMRIFLDFDNDESYTPTKMQFLAGMGVHDLQEFCEMSFEQPKGWIDVDFSNVGPITHDFDASDDEDPDTIDWDARPVLRAFLVQVRILENHQNGKDTHLRGLQIFARDERADVVRERRIDDATLVPSRAMPVRSKSKPKSSGPNPVRKASWMLEPEMR